MTIGRTFKESRPIFPRPLEIVQIKEIVDFEEELAGTKN
jgi:hypothetical protein